jgi:hypothetical protein
MIATKAPELGWSSETKQMIASWVDQLGWTNPVAGSEKQAALARTAPVVPSIDPEQVRQITRSLTTVQQSVEQLAARLDQVTGEIRRLETADVEILAKITPVAPPPRPVAAAPRKPTPVAPPLSPASIAPPTSLAPVPPPQR